MIESVGKASGRSEGGGCGTRLSGGSIRKRNLDRGGSRTIYVSRSTYTMARVFMITTDVPLVAMAVVTKPSTVQIDHGNHWRPFTVTSMLSPNSGKHGGPPPRLESIKILRQAKPSPRPSTGRFAPDHYVFFAILAGQTSAYAQRSYRRRRSYRLVLTWSIQERDFNA